MTHKIITTHLLGVELMQLESWVSGAPGTRYEPGRHKHTSDTVWVGHGGLGCVQSHDADGRVL